jgi:hypothetical protein
VRFIIFTGYRELLLGEHFDSIRFPLLGDLARLSTLSQITTRLSSSRRGFPTRYYPYSARRSNSSTRALPLTVGFTGTMDKLFFWMKTRHDPARQSEHREAVQPKGAGSGDTDPLNRGISKGWNR